MDQGGVGDQLTMQGTVKWFDPKKDFGFIIPRGGGDDVMLHGQVLRDFGLSAAVPGAKVEFLALDTDKGLHTIKLISHALPGGEEGGALAQIDPEIAKLPLIPARVKWYDHAKGFGFAQAFGDPQDIFIHRVTLLNAGFEKVETGEAICLRCDDAERGKVAVQVLSWLKK